MNYGLMMYYTLTYHTFDMTYIQYIQQKFKPNDEV